ncbi:DUF4345 domain-containing protein [Streptomyces sp. NPDC051578]|uniref:DUF4345 domain-containing protein n=1 Tax=Streptomyces sp. NPDC051578 TaxID=3365662 RepID=UPI0037AA62E4
MRQSRWTSTPWTSCSTRFRRRDGRQLGRFAGAGFVGCGPAWLWAARQRPIPSRAVRWPAGVFPLSGLGRLLCLAVHGRPQWFQMALTVIELGLPR